MASNENGPPDVGSAAFSAADSKQPARPKKLQLLDVYRVLSVDQEWENVIAFDEFSGRIVKRAQPPFGSEPGEWSDVDDTRTLMWLAKEYQCQPNEKDLVRAIDATADENKFHEVRDYLNRCADEWDGTERLEMWMSDLLGAADDAYLRIVSARWMIQAVARVMRPGCKADSVMILVGPQGEGKSTAFAILAGDWFTDAPIRLNEARGETAMLIRGKWIVELAEMDAFNKSESSAAKSFFSTYEDRYRAPWGRRPMDVKRQCVFGGTVNHHAFLRDDSGNRRYWPVSVGEMRLDALREQRDLLWGEAAMRFKRGDIWWPLQEERKIFEDVQERHYVGDAWEPLVRRFVQEQLDGKPGHEFTTTEILADGLKLDNRAMDRGAQIRIGQLMQHMGMIRRRRSEAGEDGRRGYVYVLPEKPQPGDDDGLVEL